MVNKVAINAIWNVVNLGSSVFMAVGVPPFLTRLLPAGEFGAWALMMQIAAYVNLLGFGLQTVVGRHVALARERGDRDHRDGIVASAFWMLAGLAAAATLLAAAVAPAVIDRQPAIAASTHGAGTPALLMLVLAVSINLPAGILGAVFIGEQRNHVPALLVALTRAATAVAVILAAWAFGSLRAMSAAFLGVTLVGALLTYAAWRAATGEPTLAWRCVSVRALRAMQDESIGLTEWNLCMLLIGGMNLLLVGQFDPGRLPYYAAATVLVQFVSGLLQALASATIPEAARLNAAGRGGELAALIVGVTRLTNACSVAVSGTLVLAGQAILGLWVGVRYGSEGALLLAVLASASGVRLLALPYVTVGTGLGLQRRMTATAWLEGLVTFACNVLLGHAYGALGVAWAAVCGGTVGVVAVLIRNPIGAELSAFQLGRYVRLCILPAAACIGLAAALRPLARPYTQGAAGVVTAGALTGLVSLVVVLGARERQWLWRTAAGATGWRQPPR